MLDRPNSKSTTPSKIESGVELIRKLRLEDKCVDALEASGIRTIEHLRALTVKDLLKLPLVRKSWLAQIKIGLWRFDRSRSKSVADSEFKSIDEGVSHASRASLDDDAQRSGNVSDQKPERHYWLWSNAEKEAVGKSFLVGATIEEIAKKQKRSQASIVFQLHDQEGRNPEIHFKLQSLGLLKSQSGHLTSRQPSISDSSFDNEVLNRSINTLDLSERSRRFLETQKIYLIGDLVSKKEKNLILVDNLGKTSVREIISKLRMMDLALDTDISEWTPQPSISDSSFDNEQDVTGHDGVRKGGSPEPLTIQDWSTSLEMRLKSAHPINETNEKEERQPLWSIVEEFQAALNERELLVFRGRWGYSGEVVTLEALGKEIGVTRERVRQIQTKTHRRLKRKVNERTFIQKIDALLTPDRQKPLYQAFLGLEDNFFEGLEGFEGSQAFLALLIKYLSAECFHSFHSDLGWIITRCPSDLNSALDRGKEIFNSSALEQETLLFVKLRIDAACIDLNTPELSSLVFETLKPLAFSVNEELMGMDAPVVAFGTSGKAAALGILHQNNGPMHFSEVAERMSDLLGRKISPGYALNTLSDHGALRIGRGLYGFREHINISEDIEAEICDHVEEIIESGPTAKQWHCHELITLIDEQRPDLPQIPNGHVLNVLLQSSEELKFFGRQICGLKRDSGSLDKRLDISQAVESILEKAGKPLKTKQIKSEMSKQRGTSSFSLFQRASSERLVRVAPDTWGLWDRDLPFSLSQGDEMLAILVTHLAENGCGMNQDDLSRFLWRNGIEITNPYLIFTIALRDPRLKIYPGSILGLREWNESRSITIKEAVGMAFDDLGGDAQIDSIAERASEIRGSPVSPNHVYIFLPND